MHGPNIKTSMNDLRAAVCQFTHTKTTDILILAIQLTINIVGTVAVDVTW